MVRRDTVQLVTVAILRVSKSDKPSERSRVMEMIDRRGEIYMCTKTF